MKKKVCISCKRKLDLKYFCFRKDTNKYRNQCKYCNKGYKENREDKQKKIKDLFNKGKKICGSCNKIKMIDKFHLDKYTTTGRTSTCKKCKAIRTDETIYKTSITTRASRYNISKEDVIKLLETKNCEICNKEFKNKSEICIDHCHNKGNVRGALCVRCNQALGFFNDDIETIKNAIKYLNSGTLPIIEMMKL